MIIYFYRVSVHIIIIIIIITIIIIIVLLLYKVINTENVFVEDFNASFEL